MIILDTNVISETLRPNPHYNVLTWLNEKDNDDLYLSAVVLAELFSGVACMPDGKRKREFRFKLAEAVQIRFDEQTLPFDTLCAMQYAELMGKNQRQGRLMSMADTQLAATCLHYGAALATRNTKDFIHCGIELIDPWQASTGRRLHEEAAEYYVMSRKP
ncbi:type II toxin-antitoxin system VapC family toxin [Serratia quinivorans]|uniref:type II toxin-antitoxin system VapC family toxin n=1 Tax=Serratia quinivorans TaxID=137545 RepID=UPI00217BA0A5|nr:type II toxin-antitoxin system VapC family toxin [Serratia quinivorans]CAI1120801.1 Probable ribonuclease FitB [Serratia quinivorans]CAI1190827.1 Probable ribonuclease FitB [Serratia quinivorans]CAI1190865.1 Probable ribonuclease FitB [Serratia quinivorans]CAI1914416.1 Probable ribonuclease FitB [Serratia quinivorans]CAI2153332.1 Probable ribonuclease FitB [Serratia quinivorans]